MAIQNVNTYQGDPGLATGGVLGVIKPTNAIDAFDKLNANNFLRNKQLYDAQKDVFDQVHAAAQKDVFDTEKVDPKSLPDILNAFNEYRKSASPNSYLFTPQNQQAYLDRQAKHDELQAKINADKANYLLIQKIQDQANTTPYLAPQIEEHVGSYYAKPWDDRAISPFVPALNYNLNELVDGTVVDTPVDKTGLKGGFITETKGALTDPVKTDANIQTMLAGGLGIYKDGKGKAGSGIPLNIQAQHAYVDYVAQYGQDQTVLDKEIASVNQKLEKYNKANKTDVPLIQPVPNTPLDPYQFTRAFVYTRGLKDELQTNIKSQLHVGRASGDKVKPEDISQRKQLIYGIQNKDQSALDILRTLEIGGAPVKNVQYVTGDEELKAKREQLYTDREVATDEKAKAEIQANIDNITSALDSGDFPTIIHIEAQPMADGSSKTVDLEVSEKTGGGFFAINGLVNQLKGQPQISVEDFGKIPEVKPITQPTEKKYTLEEIKAAHKKELEGYTDQEIREAYKGIIK